MDALASSEAQPRNLDIFHDEYSEVREKYGLIGLDHRTLRLPNVVG